MLFNKKRLKEVLERIGTEWRECGWDLKLVHGKILITLSCGFFYQRKWTKAVTIKALETRVGWRLLRCSPLCQVSCTV